MTAATARTRPDPKPRHCLKCGHVNAQATGSELEACPQCGAIYSRVPVSDEQRAALQASVRRRKQGHQAPVDGEHANPKRRWILGAQAGVIILGLGGWAWSQKWGPAASQRQQQKQRDAAQQLATQNRIAARNAITDYLGARLKDPKSLDVMDWGELIDHGDGSRTMVITYRATNSWGAYITSRTAFRLDEQFVVTDTSDVPRT